MAAAFSWAAAGDVAGGVASAISAWGTASANKTLTAAQVRAQNLIREAQNRQRAANGALAATVRSLANNAILANAGDAISVLGTNIARTQDSFTRSDFEAGLRDVEQLGAAQARAAAAGVGGASVQAVSQTLMLSHARAAERREERQDETEYDMLVQRAGIMPAASSRRDISPISFDLDYSMTNAPVGAQPSLLAFLTEGLLRKAPSLQVALDSINAGKTDSTQLPTGDFSRMDRFSGSINID